MRVAPGPVAALIGWRTVCKFHVRPAGLGLPPGVGARFAVIPGVVVVVLAVEHTVAMVAVTAACEGHPGQEETEGGCRTKKFVDSAHFFSRGQVRLCQGQQCIKFEGRIALAA